LKKKYEKCAECVHEGKENSFLPAFGIKYFLTHSKSDEEKFKYNNRALFRA
jgi:hypothetical protein